MDWLIFVWLWPFCSNILSESAPVCRLRLWQHGEFREKIGFERGWIWGICLESTNTRNFQSRNYKKPKKGICEFRTRKCSLNRLWAKWSRPYCFLSLLFFNAGKRVVQILCWKIPSNLCVTNKLKRKFIRNSVYQFQFLPTQTNGN